MSTVQTAQPLTIRDLEQSIENIFDRIRNSETAPPEEALSILASLRSHLAPTQFRTVVQLEEDGRKKRSTASAQNWRFESGEIVLFFEQATPKATVPDPPTSNSSAAVLAMPAPPSTSSLPPAKLEVQQCCEALAEAEKAGKQFIAFKWFRDLVLAGLPYPWAQQEDERQRVLTSAIDAGAILIKKIPNPRSPMHPTTTVLLNKSSNVVAIPSRFNPVPIQGPPASDTLLNDRGSY